MFKNNEYDSSVKKIEEKNLINISNNRHVLFVFYLQI